MSKRTKYAILASFGVAVLMGFFAGGLINHAMIDSAATNHGHVLGKYMPAMPLRGALGTRVTQTIGNSRVAPDVATMSGGVNLRDPSAIKRTMKWIAFANGNDVKNGEIISGFQYGQEIAIIKTKGGQLFAMSNKLPPFGQPTTFANIEGNGIIEPVSGTKFKLSNGQVDGPWCPSPLGKLIFSRLTSPSPVQVFPVRQLGNSIQVNINVNARLQFEANYWRGVLDAQGKVDGGYY